MITIISSLMLLASIIGYIYNIIRVYKARKFQEQTGEREAHAAYARIKREQPDAPVAKLSEAEFVHDFMKNGPTIKKPILYMFLLIPVMILGLLGSIFGSYL